VTFIEQQNITMTTSEHDINNNTTSVDHVSNDDVASTLDKQTLFTVTLMEFHGHRLAIESLEPESRNEAAELSHVVDLTGVMLWPSSKLLSSWLTSDATDKMLRNNDADNQHHPFCGRRVIEIGCGAGMCGLFLASLYKPLEMVLSDEKQHVVDLVERNRLRNAERIDGDRSSVSTIVYSWNRFFPHNEHLREHFDTLIASDTVYTRTSMLNFAHGIHAVLRPGGRAYLAYPFREQLLVEDLHRTFAELKLRTLSLTPLPPSDHNIEVDEDIHQHLEYVMHVLEKSP
jgi:predicted nicotinamide N-methyase